ncbi:MAG: type III-A CRISPR-associated RAMP protein Csm5, partial [Caldisericaceae bacterium]
MKEIRKAIPASFQIITPVHIGSGDKLISGQDYVSEGNTLKVVSVDQILGNYAKDKATLSRIEEKLSQGLPIFSVLPGFDAEKFKKYEINIKKQVGGEILSFIKDPFLKPYIPGSSIKGSIRTVILQHFLKDAPDKLFYSKDGRERVEDPDLEIFGKDALYDPMKAFVSDDIYFTSGNLTVTSVKLLDIKGNGSYGWKVMGKGA